MAIDLKKMRAKLSALHSKGNGSKFWKPPEGESVIRIVPSKDGDPFKEFWFHYNLGNNFGFLSPKRNFGEEDALDQFVRKLWEDGSDESREMAKKLMAKQRFFSPVIVRGEENEGVKVWGFSKTVYENLLQLVLNPDYGDITDPHDGTDLVITYGKAPGAMYPNTVITARRKSSKICDDKELATEVLETEIEWDALFERKTPEQVSQMLDEYLLGEDGGDSSNEGTADNAGLEKSYSVDKAFADLVG